ncbi:MAG: SIS domain-containing protein [Proteobacteria bacterium]|nr:SIS domain-containing protein [Pseudomonadota bacterium]
MSNSFADYVKTFFEALSATAVTDRQGQALSVDAGIAGVHDIMRRIARGTGKVMFVGNGGSAGIAGHLAIDFAKNGGVRSVTFNDASSLTCLGNDLGYDQVFAKQIEMQAFPGDVLIAISSSGNSKNIVNAALAAAKAKCDVITLSGFTEGNTLRQLGDINFFVASGVYGFVETGHQAILHAILDTAMGWTTATKAIQPSSAVR